MELVTVNSINNGLKIQTLKSTMSIAMNTIGEAIIINIQVAHLIIAISHLKNVLREENHTKTSFHREVQQMLVVDQWEPVVEAELVMKRPVA